MRRDSQVHRGPIAHSDESFEDRGILLEWIEGAGIHGCIDTSGCGRAWAEGLTLTGVCICFHLISMTSTSKLYTWSDPLQHSLKPKLPRLGLPTPLAPSYPNLTAHFCGRFV